MAWAGVAYSQSCAYMLFGAFCLPGGAHRGRAGAGRHVEGEVGARPHFKYKRAEKVEQPRRRESDPGSGGQRCRVSQAPAAQAHLPAAMWPPADCFTPKNDRRAASKLRSRAQRLERIHDCFTRPSEKKPTGQLLGLTGLPPQGWIQHTSASHQSFLSSSPQPNRQAGQVEKALKV